MNCLFCSIVEKKVPAQVVAENEYCLAFRDIHPQAPTHILIIPKVHMASIQDLTQEQTVVWGQMALMAQKLAKDEAIADSGFRLVVNSGQDAGQTVSHLHMHLLGGRQMLWPPG